MATFREIYENIPVRQQVSERVKFIRKIADLTKKSDFTVRQWIAGRQRPDALTQTVIARHLKVQAEELFPEPQSVEG